MTPRARRDGLLVEALADELLVFDERTQKCHVLNRTAAAVWRRCDGRAGITELAQVAAGASGLPARDEIARLALDHLNAAGLIEDAPPVGGRSAISRRAVVRRLGLAAGLAALLPAVESMVAPRAAEAQSVLTTIVLGTIAS